jgi:hypothetical protein
MNKENAGKRVRLIFMRDESSVKSGDEGTVRYEDDMGQIHVDWDSGSTLAIIPEVDEFEWIGESIKKFEQFVNEDKSQVTFGLDKSPSNIHSRQSQNFYDYHTRQRVTGKSKYELQITRESFISDRKINERLDEIEKILTNLGSTTSDLSADQDEIEDKLKDIDSDINRKLGEDI